MPDIFVAKKKEPIKATKPKVVKKETVAEELAQQTSENPLAALAFRPKKLSFDTQEKEEKIILLARRHWVTNLGWVLIILAMIFLPPLISLALPQVYRLIPFHSVLILIWYLATFSYAFEKFLKWFFNVNIITDERVVDIDFPFILYRDISSTKIDNLQDVSALSLIHI